MSTMEKGTINVQTENIFPIIKKFLYSDHEIFIRELISNATDATQKLITLSGTGEVEGDIGDTTIEVSLDKKKKTITISDKGIGMTKDEVKKYINQIAFSGATEFLEQYKDEASIIGHFGLGFYSAFMVADKVEIHTKSHRAKTKAAHWTSEGTPEFTLEDSDKKERGTDIILHISADSKEFLEKERLDTILNKFCKFLPIKIKFGENERVEKDENDVEVTYTEDNIINNTSPAWTKKPAKLKDEDYKSFYKELYPYAQDPLFQIHLNVDFPFSLTGILYFPKLNNSYEIQKNKIQLYCNQVFVTDSVEEIVPEYLMLLHGVLDSPDIPLNVSRSYLQGDPNVKKINSHISKKVADKLAQLFKKDREGFQEKWEDLAIFVKYGMLSDEKFFKKAEKFCLLKNMKGEFFTIEEYKEKIKANQTDKEDNTIMIYSTDLEKQNSFVSGADAAGLDVLVMDQPAIDSHFINFLEQKLEKVNLKRVDADTASNLIETGKEMKSVLSKEDVEKVEEFFKTTLEGSSATIVAKALSPDDQPVLVTKPEFMRRMQEMQQMQGGGPMGKMPEMYNLVVNTNHELVKKILSSRSDKREKLIKQVYDLALLSQGMLTGQALTDFINRSTDLVK